MSANVDVPILIVSSEPSLQESAKEIRTIVCRLVQAPQV